MRLSACGATASYTEHIRRLSACLLRREPEKVAAQSDEGVSRNLIVCESASCDIAGQEERALDGCIKKHRPQTAYQLSSLSVARWRNQRNATRVHAGIDDADSLS